ncbi:Bet v I/Major latex protein [Parasponia andersonii]|uniref:Bet v I/Major latex protein n=1 Tax=Parasponia andersonii TaxID=3476 RepID=A0A2P5BIM3_PARAD|nr:Bet v I/Major latex protein [Parasponia andersonii]
MPTPTGYTTLLCMEFESGHGNVEELKEKMEIDKANKTITLTALEGHILNLYKTYKINWPDRVSSDYHFLTIVNSHRCLNLDPTLLRSLVSI